jgi:hypothetical protein
MTCRDYAEAFVWSLALAWFAVVIGVLWFGGQG